ncbi:MAG: polysaccharide biosynthesis/export family protein [Candidatus Acidiferrales bacterium]
MKSSLQTNLMLVPAVVGTLLLWTCPPSRSQTSAAPRQNGSTSRGQTTQDYNRRLEELHESLAAHTAEGDVEEYRIGAQDFLEIKVFEAPEMDRSLRVAANGEISLPLVGGVQAAGLTARELEQSLQDRLREYIKDPHVGVLVSSVESHPISVLGEVNKPGVFEVREPKSLLEMLSLAQGLAQDAGDEVLVMRGAGLDVGVARTDGSRQTHTGADPALVESQHPKDAADANSSPAGSQTVQVNLKDLLDSADPRFNVPVYPGDVVKVTRAGIVYVVGGVKRPGGFVMKNNQKMSVLQALALAEGLTATSAQSHARIIRMQARTGQRAEISIDMGKILAGKAPDVTLQPSDIVFIPNSPAKSALYRATETAIATASGVVIFHP